jgi:hypothetical protein
MRLKGILTETDRWSLKPAFASLMTVAVLGLICRLPGSFSILLLTLTALGYIIAALVILAMALYCLIKKRPRTGVSVLLVLVLPGLLWRPLGWADDVAHLALTVNLGLGQLGSSSGSRDDSFEVYDWSVGLAGANTFLIQDVTGEIALPMAQHTRPPSSEEGFGEDCAGKVERLINDYYVCNI